MEGDHNLELMGCSSGGAAAGNNNNNHNSRWNPTKEQISMLENLYRQGVRTPSAEQIQQITSRLKAYGNIEGKNVFYWFQNHKARQRQKQKQESFAYLNRYFHSTPAVHCPLVYPPPFPNVVCGPYLPPQGELRLFPQYPKVLVPTGYKRKLIRKEKIIEKAILHDGTGVGYDHHLINSPAAEYNYNPMMHTSGGNQEGGGRIINSSSNTNHETLDLFPLHPTGILDHGKMMNLPSSFCSVSGGNNSSTPSSSESSTAGFDQQPFFDFFSSHVSCDSD